MLNEEIDDDHGVTFTRLEGYTGTIPELGFIGNSWLYPQQLEVTKITEAKMDIELNIDSQGRTTFDKNKFRSFSVDSRLGTTRDVIDYSCKASGSTLAPSEDAATFEKQKKFLDDLLLDCEIADSGFLPRTFWVPASGAKPRCALEQMALDVFHHHVPKSHVYDASCSGAEWWVQLRPSPTGTGRYSMHDPDPDDEMTRSGISFHWDKDEELRLLMGGDMYIHPHLSTVTYLTDLGAPTMVLNCRINTYTGAWVIPGTPDDAEQSVIEGYVSWPRQGKHLSFDGRYLHAAPSDLMEPGLFEQQCRVPEVSLTSEKAEHETTEAKDRRIKILQRGHRRVTFLVNIWLNYKPLDVNPFPDTMIDKLSKVESLGGTHLFDVDQTSKSRTSDFCNVQAVSIKDTTEEESRSELQRKQYTWPLGSCVSEESLDAIMPLAEIRNELSQGGNLCITWSKGITFVKGGKIMSTTEQGTITEPGESNTPVESHKLNSAGLDDDSEASKRRRLTKT